MRWYIDKDEYIEDIIKYKDTQIEEIIQDRGI